MTILNIALKADRAFLLNDTLLSSPHVATYCSKAIALPDLRVVTAMTGQHVMFRAWISALTAGLLGATTITDLEALAPEFFRKRWERYFEGRVGQGTGIVCVGVVAQELVAFLCHSDEGFAARRLHPGVYYGPAIVRQGPATEAIVPASGPPAAADVCTEGETVAELPWHRLVASCIDAFAIQQQQARVPIGGQLIATTLTLDAIHQTVLRELDQAE